MLFSDFLHLGWILFLLPHPAHSGLTMVFSPSSPVLLPPADSQPLCLARHSSSFPFLIHTGVFIPWLYPTSLTLPLTPIHPARPAVAHPSHPTFVLPDVLYPMSFFPLCLPHVSPSELLFPLLRCSDWEIPRES